MQKKKINYLALGGSNHDFSAALMRGNDIRVAIEQERLSRRKHGVAEWFEDPIAQSVEYCLKAESMVLADVETIVGSDTLPTRVRTSFKGKQVRLYPHHLCHAASAYLLQPQGTRAGILVFDGYGSICSASNPLEAMEARETFSFFVFTPEGYRCLGKTLGFGYIESDQHPKGVSNSLGMLYELVTSKIGFAAMESGKTMGLAPYGEPRYAELLEEFLQYGASVSSCFSCDIWNPNLVARLDDILLRNGSNFNTKADLAASVQFVFQKALVNCLRFFDLGELDCICLAGGCALNTVANSYAIERFGNDVPILIPPYCGDAGLGLGAYWLDRYSEENQVPIITFRDSTILSKIARPGRRYTARECKNAANAFYPKLVHDPSIRSGRDLAKLLATGLIIGVLVGRAEIGPRSLGGRSIFADPRSVENRERINRHLKQREPFRPLAPIVLRSQYGQYFQNERHADSYMLKVARAHERCRREAPAIVHVDGTARIQVIDDQDDEFLLELLQAFKELTGMAILINTSFNRRGEPLVESPSDAVEAFLSMGLDGLYLEGEYYSLSK